MTDQRKDKLMHFLIAALDEAYKDAFQDGAESMRAHCAAWVMTKNNIELASELLCLPLPAIKPLEKATLDGADAGEAKP